MENNLLYLADGMEKLATVVFYIAIVASLITNYFNLAMHLDIYIYYVALALTIFALIMYFQRILSKGIC